MGIAELVRLKNKNDSEKEEALFRTCRNQADQWLAFLKVSVAVGHMSKGRYDSYGRQLKPFIDFLGDGAEISTIKSGQLELYWLDQGKKVGDGKLAQATAKGNFMAAKQWIKWLAETNKIVLPTNIASRRLKFTDPPKKIETLDIDYVRGLVNGCNNYTGRSKDIRKTKLFLLLIIVDPENWTTR